MSDPDTRKALVHLAIGLLFGYTIGFLFVTLGEETLVYYIGGMILLFSMLLTLVVILGGFAIYWDMKKRSGNGIMGTVICKYDAFVGRVAGTENEYSIEEFEDDLENYNR